MRRATPIAIALLALAAFACGGDEKKDDTSKEHPDAGAADSDAPADTTDEDAGGGLPDTAPADTPAPTDAPPQDTGAVDAGGPDTGPVDAGQECVQASDCAGKLSPKACEELACEAGKCALSLKPGTCCEDIHCNDKVDCTSDKCNTDSFTCTYTPIPNCCSGKLTLMKGTFEGGAFEDMLAKEGVSNGNVKWQLSDKRAHGGKSSLYFGNECGTYDNAMTADGSCVPKKGGGSAVSTVLSTKTFALPGDKQSQLHFWLWLDTEPSYKESLPPGNCQASPCALGQSCVSVGGKSQCIPEKDVLTVQIQGSKSGTKKVFDSTSIGKTTGSKWRRVLVDLDAFKGQSVTVRWIFSTATGIKNNFEGIYLDDIVLETVCAVEGTLCTADKPCLDDKNPCTEEACSFYVNKAAAGVCFHDVKPGCCLTAGDCADGNACTADACVEGVCTHQPDAGKPGCCKKAVLGVDDFESGVLSQWTLLGGNSNDVKWRIDPKGGTGGSQGLYFGNATHDGYADPALPKGTGPKGMACMKATTLKAGTLYNIATFKLRMETEWSFLPAAQYKNPPLAGKPKYDHLAVVVEGGGTPEQAWSSDLVYGTTDGKWVPITVVLDKWQGKTVQICLSFDAGDDKVNDKAGVHVDDFVIKVACDKKPCYLDAECKGSCKPCEAMGCSPTGCKCLKIEGCCQINEDCDDKNACTTEVCKGGKCDVQKIAGCCGADADCSSEDACKKAVCDVKAAKCGLEPIAGCCKDDAGCDDGDKCTADACDKGKHTCTHTAIPDCK